MNEIIDFLKTVYHRELLPHWIEALSTFFGALFAFGGLVFAWKSLKRDISKQQEQIITLTQFTEALGNQTEALTKSASIDSQILEAMRKHFLDNTEIARLEQEKEKIRVKPNIVFRHISYTPFIISFFVENIGIEEARKVKLVYENLKTDDVSVSGVTEKEKLGLIPDGIGINFQTKHYALKPLPDDYGNISVYFEDIYGNKYKNGFEIKKQATNDIIINRILQEEMT